MDIVSYCVGCFNGSLYIFPFTRSVGTKWTLSTTN